METPVAIHYHGSQVVFHPHTVEVLSPYDDKVVSRYPLCSVEDANKALLVAQKSFEQAKLSTLSQRVQWFEDIIGKLILEKNEIAKTITDETGKPIMFSKVEVERCIETFRLSIHAGLSLHGQTIPTDAMPSGKKTTSFSKRVPAGVVVAITPFNFPLNLVAHKLAPALMAGCSVVLKPTPEAPLTASKLAQIIIESPYAIKDALSVVYGDGDVGGALVASPIPRVISFTGSVPVGKIITKNAGIKKVSLELGGNGATYIDRSANLEHAAIRCALGAFINSGQVCISLQRIYVHEEVYDQFASLLASETQKLILGDPYCEKTFMGPLINDDAVNRAMDWVSKACAEGAKVVVGGKAEGRIMHPTILRDVDGSMKIACEEVFAPVVSLFKVNSFDEAVEKINTSTYGLQYSLFTNDLNQTLQGIEKLHCGGVVINDMPTLRFDIQPYGGVGESGIGREGPLYAIEEYTELKTVIIC